MRMARVNVYLPDDLAAEAKEAGLNVSAVTQAAIRSELQRNAMAVWLDELASFRRQGPPIDVSHDDVIGALDEARRELWGD